MIFGHANGGGSELSLQRFRATGKSEPSLWFKSSPLTPP